jgi:cytochrome c oxidase subunit 1
MNNNLKKFLFFLGTFILVTAASGFAVAGLGLLLDGTFTLGSPINWFVGVLVGLVVPGYIWFRDIPLVRGLFWQVVGLVSGAVFVTLIRELMKLMGNPDMKSGGLYVFSEPAWVFGGFVGTLAFLAGHGVMADWFKWWGGKETAEHHEDEPGWLKYFGPSLDHKVIGIQYTVTAILLLVIGGSFALIFRTELSLEGTQFLNPGQYNTLMSLHGMIMIVSILLGIAGLMNYLVPLLIGAHDMAFPRLNAFSFWIAVPAAVWLLMSMPLGGVETGWTGYPPLSANPLKVGQQMFFLGVFVAGWSSILGSLNLITTVFRMRAKGMTAFRMPIFVWAALATSLISLTATQLIGLSFQMVMFQRLFGMGFFDPAKGGNPILFQHLFWFYSHPAVYVFILPGLGIVSELLPVFVRKPLFGYKWIAMSSLGIALVGFLVWAHHMYTSGMNEYLRVPFMYSTLLVAVPTGVKFFSWVATIWKGKIPNPMPAAFLFVMGAIVVFLLGGLSGPPNATVSTDLHLQDTYWIVGHFHDTLFGGFVFPFFAALYYWFPKATGRRLNEKLGKLHFWLMTPSFLVLSLLMMRVGLLGMRRRIFDYDPALHFQPYHIAMTIAAFLIALSVLILIINMFMSIKNGEPAQGNIWNSRSPEWQVASPMPAHNYETPFEVVGEPYDYGLPGSKYVEFMKK